MKKNWKGSVTIMLASGMMMFLTFCLVLTEGARIYFLRAKAARAMELTEFSVLSDYQQELFRNYGVFFIDLDYETGMEQTGLLEKRAEKYLTLNAEELQKVQLSAEKYVRATDGKGVAFFRQAVEWKKVKSGYKVLEGVLEDSDGFSENDLNLEEMLDESERDAEEIFGEYKDADGILTLDISLPDVSFPSIGLLRDAVFGAAEQISDKEIVLADRLGQRKLVQGVGKSEQIGIMDMQLFHGYLLDQFSYYGDEDSENPAESLEYQLEYIVSGKASDKENLENIMWRIFLLRAGSNYLFYHQDAGKMAEAEGWAIALVGITGNPTLIQTVQELFLISWAVEDGIEETKKIFEGEKVAVYKDGGVTGIKFGYEEYLYLFLNLTGAEEKIYRCMDVIELEVRNLSGYEMFRMDHCTDRFQMEWTYQFESLFELIPLLNGGSYENTIKRTFNYET